MSTAVLRSATLAALCLLGRAAAAAEQWSCDLSAAANVGFADPVAGDGRGGWSDQGPDNDFADVDLARRSYAGVPFTIIDPQANGGRAVLSFRHRTLPTGLERAALGVPAGAHGRWLYLLHTSCWNSLPPGGLVGEVAVRGGDGAVRTLPVRAGHEVADWWHPAELSAARVVTSRMGGAKLGIYLARIDLGAEVEPAAIELRSTGAALWIVVGATLSARDLPLPPAGGPGDPVVIAAGEDWRPLAAAGAVQAGSALDLAAPAPGRLVGAALDLARGLPADAAGAAALAAALRHGGCNLVALDGAADVLPDRTARFDALLAALRAQDVRVLLRLPGDLAVLAGDAAARSAWTAQARALLAHPRPGDGVALAADPLLAAVTAPLPAIAAEQGAPPGLLTAWRAHLAARYAQAEAWRDAWVGQLPAGVDDPARAPLFSTADLRDRGQRGRDVADFLVQREAESTTWLGAQIRAAGWTGLLAAGPDSVARALPQRAALGAVAALGLGNQPTHGMEPGSQVSSWGGVAGGLTWWRGVLAQRVGDVPLLVVGAGQTYWDGNRRETGLALGAHAALADVPLVVAGAVADRLPDGDPIAAANAALTALLYGGRRIAPGSRSEPVKGVTTVSTGEITLRAWQGRLEVAAPGAAGLVLPRVVAPAEAGGLRVESATAPLACTAVDLSGRGLAEAGRLLLVLATDARRAGEAYDDADLSVLRRAGGGPWLLRTGRFTVALRHAAPLRAWALALDGRRVDEIAVEAVDGWQRLRIDTRALPGGATPIVELATAP